MHFCVFGNKDRVGLFKKRLWCFYNPNGDNLTNKEKQKILKLIRFQDLNFIIFKLTIVLFPYAFF